MIAVGARAFLGPVALLLLGPGVRPGTRLRHSQYSLLATVEDRFGLSRLLGARSASALDLGGAS